MLRDRQQEAAMLVAVAGFEQLRRAAIDLQPLEGLDLVIGPPKLKETDRGRYHSRINKGTILIESADEAAQLRAQVVAAAARP